MIELLQTLTALPGPSGFEQAPAAYMRDAFRARGAQVEIDRMGSVIAYVPGASPARKLMLCAHTDEVGLMVRYIDDGGMIYCDPIGLLNPEALPGARVELMVEFGETPVTLPGVIGVRSPHLARDARPLALRDLWIDAGADSRAAAEAMGIRIGTPVVFRADFAQAGGCVIGKALDNRMGCALLLLLLDEITKRVYPLPYDLYLTAVVQEEVGSRGAQVAARRIQPDWAIAIDTVPAADPAAAAATPPASTVALGGGPSIRSMDMMPNMLGTLYAPVITAHLEAVARANDIPTQRDVSTTWTDAATMEGVLRGGVYVPRRYAHGPAELMSLHDLDAALRLLVAFLYDDRTAGLLGGGPWR
ncbi:MAG: M42 family metallopeptidase [Anaerolineae bacterium]|nr:M42 family metallopeptidase [Anaerolineae bacterium]